MRTLLGTEVDLVPGHIVLKGVPALHERGTAAPPPPFSSHVYCGHGRPSQLLLSFCLTYKTHQCHIYYKLLEVYDSTQTVSVIQYYYYCTDVAQRWSTKLCMICGRLLSWYTIYMHFRGLLPGDEILLSAKFTCEFIIVVRISNDVDELTS